MGRIEDWDRLFKRTEESGDFIAVMLPFSHEEEYNGVLYSKNAPVFNGPERTAERAGDGEYAAGGMGKGNFPKRFGREAITAEESFWKSVKAYEMAYERYEAENEENRLLENVPTELLSEEYTRGIYSSLREEEESFFCERDALLKGQTFLWKGDGESAGGSFFDEGGINNVEEGFLYEGEMTLTRETREAILDGGLKRNEGTRKHEIKVEMVSGGSDNDSADVDEMLEEMTARLCAMMMKGADGIYL